MMSHERVIAWQKAMELAEEIYRLMPLLPVEERYGMRSQMTRASVSTPSNIAEGWARNTERDRARFVAIAHGSLCELNTQLMLCVRLGWITPEQAQRSSTLIDEISRIFNVLRQRMKASIQASSYSAPRNWRPIAGN